MAKLGLLIHGLGTTTGKLDEAKDEGEALTICSRRRRIFNTADQNLSQ